MAVTFFFFQITSDSILTVHDDILTYMQVREGHLWQTAISDARHGRICHIPLTFLLYIPYIFNSGLIVRICAAAAIIFDMFAFYTLIRKNVDKCAAYVSCLLFISFACISNQHNLFVAYIVGHQIGIGLVMFSLDSFLSYYKSKKNSKLILSAILLFAAASLYEAMAVYIIVFVILAMYKSNGNIFENCIKIISNLRFHILFLLAYVVIYFTWQNFFPSDYDGAKLYFGNIPQSIITILIYSFGMIPGLPLAAMLYKHTISLTDIPGMIDIKMIIVALLTAAAFFFVFPKIDLHKKSKILIIICGAGILIPNIMVGFTSKYVSWSQQKSYAYVTSFYSYFFIISLAVIIMHLIYRNNKIQKPVLVVMSILVFIISLLCCVNNKAWNNTFEKQLKRYEAFYNAVSDDYFDNIEDGTVIYIPDYTGIHHDMNITKTYASIYTSRDITFQNDTSKIDFSKPVICMRYDEVSGAMFIGHISSDFISSDLYICGEYDSAVPENTNMETIFK